MTNEPSVKLKTSVLCCVYQDGRTALHLAAASGGEKVVQRLLNGTADVNAIAKVCAELLNL